MEARLAGGRPACCRLCPAQWLGPRCAGRAGAGWPGDLRPGRHRRLRGGRAPADRLLRGRARLRRLGRLRPALAAELGGCAVDFFWARLIARDWAARRIRGRLARLDQRLSRHPFSATLTLRLLPVGNNILLNLIAGVSAVAPIPFLAASTIGYIPQTIVFGLLGSGTRVDRSQQFLLAAALFALATLLGLWLMRRMRAASGQTGLGTEAGPL